MKNQLLFFILLGFTSCQLFDSESKIPVDPDLEKIYEEIISLANSQTCQNAHDWDFVALGSKPCGGPWEYLAYSREINVGDFLAKVKRYNELQKADNIKNNRFSDCMFVMPPTGIFCENGKAILLYD